jgi:hypothetical protein
MTIAPVPPVEQDHSVMVHVRIDRSTLLSLAHEPGAPMSAYLQVVGTDAYIALEVTDLAAARRLADLAVDLESRLLFADERLQQARADHPSAQPAPHLRPVQ